MVEQTCFLCDEKASTHGFTGDPGKSTVQCDICGMYVFERCCSRSDTFIENKHKLASVAAEIFLKNKEDENIYGFILVRKKNGTETDKYPVFTVEEFLEQYPQSPLEILDRSLLNLSRKVQHPSDWITLDGNRDAALLFSKDKEQVAYVLKELLLRSFIRPKWEGVEFGSASNPIRPDRVDYVFSRSELPAIQIACDGWQRIEQLKSIPAGNKKQAFVARWFSPEMDEIHAHGIKPAVEHDDTVKCVPVNEVEHNNKICDQIVAEIRRSKYVVADFTGNRGGVYYEAGFAHGLGIPVICIGRKDYFFEKDGQPKDSIHFDTRQYNHIFYDDAEDLKEKLTARIRATIV